MRKLVMTMLLCGAATPCFAQDMAAVQQASRRFTSALSSADVAAAMSMFSDDAVVLPPGRAELKTRPEIQGFLGTMTRGVQNLKYTSEDIRPVGDGAAREIGSFSFKSRGQNVQEVSGKYVLVWVKAGGEWKVSADVWNRNAGAQGGERPARGGNGQGSNKRAPTVEQ